jgi:hypothetical protein
MMTPFSLWERLNVALDESHGVTTDEALARVTYPLLPQDGE